MVLDSADKAPKLPAWEDLSLERKKIATAKAAIEENPHHWLGRGRVANRDRALFFCESVGFLGYDYSCYLGKICYSKKSEGNSQVHQIVWSSENDLVCRKIVADTGGTVSGFRTVHQLPESDWTHMKVDVKITIPTLNMSHYGGTWGILSAVPTKIRIYRGPHVFCAIHTCDAMIMYDCTVSTEGDLSHTGIASRKWDLLLMEICEDYRHSWIVLGAQDSGSVKGVLNERHLCYGS